MIEADLVVFATPVYWYAMKGPMKDFLDRFSKFVIGPQKRLPGNLRPRLLEAPLVVSAGMIDFQYPLVIDVLIEIGFGSETQPP